MPWKRDRSQLPALSELEEDYQAACDAEDYDRQVEILGAMTTSYPVELAEPMHGREGSA
jgi:hypothetical protein